MKVIKARAWSESEKKFYYFEGLFNKRPFIERSSFPQYESCPEFIKLSEPELFTGLHDKNGREIYEVDILRCSVKAMGDRVVGWESTEWCLFKNGTPMSMHSSFWEKSEVIGNIHENPDLFALT